MNEIWKKIEGYKDYEVSNLGRVRSLKYGKEKILKNRIGSSGYYRVYLHERNNTKDFKIHQLVAMAFLNHKPCGLKLVVNHKDFNKLNNNVCNLEIVTSRENSNQKHLKSASKYVGVTWNKRNKKWQSYICINSKVIHLGYFINEDEAGKIYELALINIELFNGNRKQFRETLKKML